MGVLRLILALAVLISHTPSSSGLIPRFIHPVLAVHIFYVISGFYMQLVIPKYLEQTGGIKSFYTNRFLRIFPIYWVVLICSMILFKDQIAYILHAALPMKIFYIFSSVFILGQDLRNTDMGFGLGFIPLSLVPQAWTLVPEILFYIFAPFLLKKSSYILLGIIIFSITLRIVLYNFGFNLSFWHYLFFPIELGTFLLGSLSCRIYNFAKTNIKCEKLFNYVSLFAFIIIFFNFEMMFLPGQYGGGGAAGPGTYPSWYWAKILLTALSLPMLFHFSKDLKIDRYLGDFSYPLYISHFFVIGLINKLDFSKEGLDVQVILLTFLLSYLLKEYIDKPIHNIKESFTWSSIYRILNLLKVTRDPIKIMAVK